MDAWAYQERYDQEQSYMRQGESDKCGVQDEGSKTKMVRSCEEEACRGVSEEV